MTFWMMEQIISDKLLRPVGPLQLDLSSDFGLQPARWGQRPTLLNTQGQSDCDSPATWLQRPTLLQLASQPAAIGLLPMVPPTDLRSPLRPTCADFWKYVIIFVMTTPVDIKNPAHVLHMVVTRLCAKFRHRKTRRLGGDRPQTK